MAPRRVFHCSVTCLRHLVLLLVALHSAGPTGWCCQVGVEAFFEAASPTMPSSGPVCDAPRRTCCSHHAVNESAADPIGSPFDAHCCCPRDATPPEARVIPTQPAHDLCALVPPGTGFLASLVTDASRQAPREPLAFDGRPVRVHVWNCCWLC
jgi:hypothetical protein